MPSWPCIMVAPKTTIKTRVRRMVTRPAEKAGFLDESEWATKKSPAKNAINGFT